MNLTTTDYRLLASKDTQMRLYEKLVSRNFIPHLVKNKEDALTKIISLIPDGSEIATGSSETLREIGFIEILKSGNHNWKNLKENLFSEIDHLKREELRRESVLSDYNIQSVHAITENGQLLIASGIGNQLSAIAYSSRHVIFVVGAQKIVPTMDDALDRLNNFVIPMENERMKFIGFKKGTRLGKYLVVERELRERLFHIIIVNELLGF